MALTEMESKTLVSLMKKVEFPISPEMFDAWCGSFVTNPIELAVLRVRDGCQEVFMIYRNDAFYVGWHMPGSIYLPGNTVQQVIQRLVKREIKQEISATKFVGYVEVSKAENPRGQELSLLFVSWLVGNNDVSHGKFFPLENPPPNTLEHHKKLLQLVARHPLVVGQVLDGMR